LLLDRFLVCYLTIPKSSSHVHFPPLATAGPHDPVCASTTSGESGLELMLVQGISRQECLKPLRLLHWCRRHTQTKTF
jgi:hypothetical protein